MLQLCGGRRGVPTKWDRTGQQPAHGTTGLVINAPVPRSALPSRKVLLWLASIIGAISFSQVALAGVDPFNAMVLPSISNQEVATQFDLTFEVDATAMQFNGYEIKLSWDPDIISLDHVQEGSLMTGGCANNFTNLTFTDSTLTYSHVLLCGGVSLDGPGVLSIFTFNADALGSTPVDLVSDPNRTFFDEGLFISPSHPTFPRQVFLFDAAVNVTSAAAVGDGDRERPFALAIVPNPVSRDAVLRLRGSEFLQGAISRGGPVQVDITDVTGRRLEHWSISSIEAGSTDLNWRAVDRNGQPLPAGTYFYRARAGSELIQGKIQVVR